MTKRVAILGSNSPVLSSSSSRSLKQRPSSRTMVSLDGVKERKIRGHNKEMHKEVLIYSNSDLDWFEFQCERV